MTQKEKIMELTIALQRVKNVASNLEYDAHSYDVEFPKQRAEELREIVDNALKNVRNDR